MNKTQLMSAIRKLPMVKAREIDGEESDGTPISWRDRPFVSLTQLERLLTATQAAPVQPSAPWLCIKPQCPPNCDGCNHAVRTASPQALIARLLNEFANDGHGSTYEDGDHPLVDEARAFVCAAPQPPFRPQNEKGQP